MRTTGLNNRKQRRDSSVVWLERSNPLKGLSITDALNIFDCARNGDTQRLHWLFAEIERANPILFTCVERRAAALSMKPWQVTARPSADEALGEAQKQSVEEFLAGIENFAEMVEHLDNAFFRGFAYAQPIWTKDGRVKDVSLLPSWHFLEKDGVTYFNPACNGFTSDAQTVDEAWLISLKRARAIDFPALSIHIREAVGERDWGRFLERYALPKPAVFMAENATQEQRNDYLDAARSVENGEVSVWPFGTNMMDFAGGSRGTDPFSSFIRHQEELIVLLSTGGTLTSLAQADTGSLAGGAQMDVWREIVARDARLIAQVIQRDLISRFLDFHFPGKPQVVDFAFDLTTKPTPKEMAEVAAVLKGAGYLVNQAELEEATGFTLEKAPEMPSMAPQFAMNKEPNAKTPLQNDENRLQNASKASDGQVDPSDAPPSQIAKKRPNNQLKNGEGADQLATALENLFEEALAEAATEELKEDK